MLIRAVSLCLIVTMLAGCATTREIHFDSKPTGATVRLLDSTCVTPCAMQVASNEAQFAEMSLGATTKKVVRIEARPNSSQVGYKISSAGATTLKYIAYPLLALGIVGLVLITGDETDSFNNRNYEVGKDGFYITIGALVTGTTLAFAAHSMEHVSSDLKPEQDVYVVFEEPADKSGSDNSPLLTIEEFINGNTSFPANMH